MLLACLLLSIALALPARGQFLADNATVTVGKPVLVRIPPGAETLRVTYRPGSQRAATDVLPTHGRPAIVWAPVRTGLATLAVPDGPAQNVAIRPATMRSDGVAMLLLAGLILFGGAARAARDLSRPTPQPRRSR
mgnify:CR=1 FL=1